MRRVRIFALAIALSSVALAPIVVSGCTEEAKERIKSNASKARRQNAENMLRERVDEFWVAFRWDNWHEAALLFEESDDQLAFLRKWASQDSAPRPKIDAVEVKYIFVDPETRESGTVAVSYNEIPQRSTEVNARQIEQSWYKHNARWWLAPEGGPPHLREPEDAEAAAAAP